MGQQNTQGNNPQKGGEFRNAPGTGSQGRSGDMGNDSQRSGQMGSRQGGAWRPEDEDMENSQSNQQTGNAEKKN
jgi:hypothetical protein